MHKETGIIMSGDHPQLVLKKLKTMTRRTAGLNEINENPDDWDYIATDGLFYVFRHKYTFLKSVHTKCPYGQVGDRLYIKETFMFNKGADARESFIGTNFEFALGDPPHYLYRADDSEEVIRQSKFMKWRPSIFMPKKAARIWTEITGLRAERVQEITSEDCVAEGIAKMHEIIPTGEDELMAFACLWDSLNAKRGYGWDFNPFVWCISFKLLTER